MTDGPGAATKRPTQAVVLAGGRGTRLQPISHHTHKAMVRFAGKPFMGHIVDRLREEGFEKVLFLLGFLTEQFTEHFEDGADYGIEVEYDVLGPEDLTAKRVLHAWEKIDDTFLLLYCDNYWPMSFDRMWEHYRQQDAPCQITVYSNEDGWTSDSVIVEDGMCRVFDRTRTTPGLQGVEISYAILTKDAIRPLLPDDGDELFEQAVYPPLADDGRLAAYWTRHRYMSVGGHARLPITRAFFEDTPAILLDRDGTLIERPPKAQYVERPSDVAWLPGALEALRLLREAGYRIYVVTNQAGINRGMLTVEQVKAVNDHVRHEAIAFGGWIHDFYVCPHHWDEGCDCRKPEPGMLLQAHRDHHLDLSRTWFLGDDERDGHAAWRAEMPFALITEDRPLIDRVEDLLAGTLKPEEYRP